LTRFWALLLTALTAGAIWLTVVGPAVQTGAAQFGFLPQFGPFEFAAWVPLAWQVSILVVALAVLFGGPGAASFDRAIFRRRGLDDDDEDWPPPPSAPDRPRPHPRRVARRPLRAPAERLPRRARAAGDRARRRGLDDHHLS